VISESEFERLLERKPGYMTREQYIESIIDKQLLIQEAVRMEINREESFRSSVENFYEQSLVKILLDRRLDAMAVDVSNEELSKYEEFLGNTLRLTKWNYPSLADAKGKSNETVQTIESDFVDLSDDLKYVALTLEKGALTRPKKMGMEGVVVYRVDEIRKKEAAGPAEPVEFDIKKASLFIQDQKKEQLLSEWTEALRETAEIWRKK
jgi:hypothetical protein